MAQKRFLVKVSLRFLNQLGQKSKIKFYKPSKLPSKLKIN